MDGSFVGYVALLVTSVVVIGGESMRRRDPRPLLRTHSHIVLYIGLAMAVFFHVRRLDYVSQHGLDAGAFLNQRVQTALLIESISILLQYWILSRTKSLFFRMVNPAMIHVALGGWIVYAFGWGIINVTWFLIFGGALAGFILIASIFHGLNGVLETAVAVEDIEERRGLLDLVRDEMNRFLKMGLQAFLALAASIGVSMSILLRPENPWQRPDLLASATMLVVAFGLVGLGLAIWLLKPYLDAYYAVRHHYEETLSKEPGILLSGS